MDCYDDDTKILAILFLVRVLWTFDFFESGDNKMVLGVFIVDDSYGTIFLTLVYGGDLKFASWARGVLIADAETLVI